MSWEEGLEEGPDIEEESELPSDEAESVVRDGVREGLSTPDEKQPCVDLGRLVEDLVDLRQELEEELNGDCKKTSQSSREDQEETSSSSRDNREENSRSLEVVQCEVSSSSGEHQQENHSTPGENQERTWQSKLDDDNGESGGAQGRQVQEAINKTYHAGHQDDMEENSNPESLPKNSSQEKEHLPEEQMNADTSGNSDKKDEEQEERREQSAPRVLSKVALFQVKAYQPKGSPETVRPSYGHKILDTSLKISPRGPGALWVTVSTKTDDSTVKSPTTPDAATEGEDLPPPKVSELKKKFEQ